MVEKYNSFDPPISKEEFCSNHSRSKVTVEDFGIWINLYDEYISACDKPKHVSLKKPNLNIKSVKNKLTCEEKKKRKKEVLQLKQIQNYRNIVISEKYLFSNEERKHIYRFDMFFNDTSASQIYRLGLYLARDLKRAETHLEDVNKKLITAEYQIKKLEENLTSVQKSLDFELERHPSQIVFEINPSKHNQVVAKEESLEKEELSYLCESSITNLKASLSGVYKILGGLQL
jgi:hypothetical protein